MRFPALSTAGGAARGYLSLAVVPAVVLAFLAPACRRATTGPERPRDRAATDLVPAEVSAERGVHIALFYSSNVQGEFEDCGCPSHPEGGLARRATLIDRARAEADGVLVVDAGDMLLPAVFHSDRLRPPEPTEVERRARLLLDSYARMGVAAMLPAERDLGIGLTRLRRLLQASGVPVVASNLVDGQGRPLFDRDRLVTIAGVPIGIFGVVQPLEEDRRQWERWDVRATDPTAAAREEISSLKARGARMVVALVHLGSANATRELLRAAPGITWAVQGHAGMQFESPETVGGARLLEAMSQGKLAGRLDIHIVDGKRATTTATATAAFTDRGERAQVLAILADHRRQLADLEKRATEDKTEQLRAFYILRREGLTKAIDRDIALARRLPTALVGSWFENHIIALDPSIPDHPDTAVLVRAYTGENARRTARGLPVGIEMRVPAPPSAHPQ